MQEMEPNDSQVHSHFWSCTDVGVPNAQSLSWKGKQPPNQVIMIPLETFWSVDA